MRKLGDIQGREQAEKVVSYLRSQDIGVEILDSESGDKNLSEVWVVNEDQLFAAHAFFKEYLADPESDKFVAAKTAQILKLKPKKVEKPSRARNIDVRSEVWSKGRPSIGMVTLSIIIVSCMLTFMMAAGTTAYGQ